MPEGDAELEFLRTFLADRDASCPNCQYNLRALTGGICPECGERIVIRVAMAEPKQAAMIAGLIGLAAGTGFNGLILIYLGILVFIRGIPVVDTFWTAAVLLPGSGVIVLGTTTILWLRAWRAIRNKSKGVRWSLVIACWGLILVDVVIFSLSIR